MVYSKTILASFNKSSYIKGLNFFASFLLEKLFPEFWESKQYLKKNTLKTTFYQEVDQINVKRLQYGLYFISFVLVLLFINDLLPSKYWASQQSNLFLIADSIMIFMIALLSAFYFLRERIPFLRLRYRILPFTFVFLVIIWSTAISCIETSQINYFVTYIICILAISVFFYMSALQHFFFLILGYVLLKVHFFWHDSIVDNQSQGYYLIVIIQSILTFIIARIFLMSRMEGFVSQQKLMRLNQDLDRRVIEKTKELTEANKVLEDEIESRKRYQRILTEAKKRAEESDLLKSTFLANMSHEIRTPMNGILGFAELLSVRDLGKEKTKRYLDLIYSNSKQLLVIINDILDISKIEANQLEVYPEKIVINKFLREELDFFSEIMSKTKKHTLEIQLEIPKKTDELKVVADPVRLNQILNNLIKNAIKFTEKGTISFGYSKTNEMITFFVKDTGIGIPSSKIDFVFNRFNQVDSSPERSYGGTGLGLTISKGLVELMGGAIWCQSEIGKGSTFYFSIPNSNAVAEKGKEIGLALENKKQILFNLTVLVVEDDFTSFNLIKEFLEEYKVKVIHAINGNEAIDFCASNPEISIVLMDVHMPGMDGVEATRHIKKCRDDLPVVAQTADTKFLDKNEIWDDVILKPINEKELLTKLVKNLDKN